MFFGTEDTQPKLYMPENREKFEGSEKSVRAFKNHSKTLRGKVPFLIL